jgi:hypothetical protein
VSKKVDTVHGESVLDVALVEQLLDSIVSEIGDHVR